MRTTCSYDCAVPIRADTVRQATVTNHVAICPNAVESNAINSNRPTTGTATFGAYLLTKARHGERNDATRPLCSRLFNEAGHTLQFTKHLHKDHQTDAP